MSKYRNLILESARKLFSSKHFEQVTIKEICQDAGVANSTFYYHFKTKARFEELIKEHAFIEYAKVHDNYYGTLKAPIVEVLAEGSSMILDIDVQGAAKVREYVRNLPNTDPLKIGYVDIFINPPSMEELRARLEGRGTDAPDVIERRMANAAGEMARAGEYMFQVTNDDLGMAYKRLCDLIDALSGRM